MVAHRDIPVKFLIISAWLICFVILQINDVSAVLAEDEYDYEDAFLSDEISNEDPVSPFLDDKLCTNQERVRIIAPRGVGFI